LNTRRTKLPEISRINFCGP